jgi:cephalosporin hydroxylase
MTAGKVAWQMSTCERFALEHVVRDASPDVAIEIGTYQGGSLRVLSSFAKDVATVDIDPTVPDRLASTFPRVRFCTGDSSKILDELLAEYTAAGRSVGLILIDGDHSREGVGRDVRAILRWRPNCPCVV